jgi:hypothetical protein
MKKTDTIPNDSHELLYYDAVLVAVRRINLDASEKLEILLETKHLYQRLKLSAQEIVKDSRGTIITTDGFRYDKAMKDKFAEEGFRLLNRPLTPAEANDHVQIRLLTLQIGNADLFCSNCDALKVFSPIFLARPLHPLILTPPSNLISIRSFFVFCTSVAAVNRVRAF